MSASREAKETFLTVSVQSVIHKIYTSYSKPVNEEKICCRNNDIVNIIYKLYICTVNLRCWFSDFFYSHSML